MKRLILTSFALGLALLLAACGSLQEDVALTPQNIEDGPNGCTPGYWKNVRKHGDSWPTLISIGTLSAPPEKQTLVEIGPETELGEVFRVLTGAGGYAPVLAAYPFLADLADDTLIEALNYKKFGSSLEGAVRNLFKHAVAALLNETVFMDDYGATGIWVTALDGDGNEIQVWNPKGVAGVVDRLFIGFDENDQPIPNFDKTGVTRALALHLKDVFDAENNGTCPLN